MLTREDLQAIAGLLVPLETRIGELETKFDKFEIRVKTQKKIYKHNE